MAVFCHKFSGIYERDRHFPASDRGIFRSLSGRFPEAQEKNTVQDSDRYCGYIYRPGPVSDRGKRGVHARRKLSGAVDRGTSV